jgi:Leucine-rich repeat (LRR) protein
MLSGLYSLTYLSLYENKIQSIPDGLFASTPNLQQIDMSSNQITTLQHGAFSGLENLYYLYLNNNQINTIASGALAGLTNLYHLYLSYNQLYSVETGAFTNIFQERGYLYLDYNDLKTLPASLPNEVGNIYINAYNNCLDSTFLAAGTQSLLGNYDRNRQNYQYLCTAISYDPIKPIS